MQKIVTFLVFNDQAEEAVSLYVSVFKNSKIKNIVHMGGEVPGTPTKFLHATFELEGQEFQAINGGPHFSFAQGISLFVNCETQDEVDELWDKLSEGGEIQQCGWLKDKFGVSWQIIPTALIKLMGDKDRVKAGRVMQAMLQMKKIDIAGLEKAYEGK
ncbi:MAG TPA: VOC family protein [Terriglobales bacterium]